MSDALEKFKKSSFGANSGAGLTADQAKALTEMFKAAIELAKGSMDLAIVIIKENLNSEPDVDATPELMDQVESFIMEEFSSDASLDAVSKVVYQLKGVSKVTSTKDLIKVRVGNSYLNFRKKKRRFVSS